MKVGPVSVELESWLEDMREEMERNTYAGLLLGVYYAYVGGWLTVSTRTRWETNVYERDWDVLLLLDTCRVDALEEVADEYDFLGDIDSVWSVGSTSGEWVARTFDERYREEIEATAYVTANPHSNSVLRKQNAPPQYVAAPITAPDWNYVSPEDFLFLDEIWDYASDDSSGVVPPRITTDRAITAAREKSADRLIVHYMQPHEPYVVDGEVWKDPLDDLQAGNATRQEVWDAYLDNLRSVLDNVELLLENVTADKVVISADHGEMFGGWHNYGHPVGLPHPAVKKVPWVETTATDTETYTPETYEQAVTDDDARAQLEALGYR